MSETFTLDELLSFLGTEGERVEGYRTKAEWAQALGICQSRVRMLMLAARERGKLSLAWEHRAALDGRMTRVPVYRFEVS